VTDLSIIIVNWRSAGHTRRCLTSIAANAGDLDHEVIVVDNASNDGCEDMIRNEFPGVKFIQTGKNLGFAGANNLGFAQSRGRSILFLNPDTEIRASALQTLLAALDSLPQAGIVGARLLNSDLSLQTTCVTALPSILNQAIGSAFLRRRFPKWKLWGMQPLFDGSRGPAAVEAISGACMMGRREVIAQVGVFSTDYFMYSEDMDLCLKIVKQNSKIYYVPDAVIVHHSGASSSSRAENHFSSIMLRESLNRFMRLHRGALYAGLYRASIALTALLRMLMLLAVLPLTVIPRYDCVIGRPFRKWLNLFKWSLGLVRWASHRAPSPEST
jgi:GT2 family glycosyltransferase